MKKHIITFIVGAVLLGYTIPGNITFANENDTIQVTQNTLVLENIQQNDRIDFTDFDLEKEIDSLPSVHEMTVEEKKLFDKLVNEEVGKHGQANPELYKQVLTDFFDESSGHAGDLNYAANVLENKTLINNDISTMGWDWIPDIKIGTNLAGSILNVAIGVAVGGGVGAIQGFIVAKGKKEAQRIFTKTVTSKLTEWGAPKLAIFVGAAVAIALDYSDIGAKIAEYLDSKDSKPNNGWIEIYEF